MDNDQECQTCKYKDSCIIFNDNDPEERCRWLDESLIEESNY